MVPTLEEFLAEVDDLLEQDRGTIKADLALDEAPEWDSMAVLGIMAKSDEKYGIRLRPADLERCATFGDIYQLLKRTGA